MKIFDSDDSRYMLKSALLITLVPLLMLGLIYFSLWLLMAVNFSYFKSVGLMIAGPAEEQTFIFYVLKSQIDYFPYLGLFFIGVFFLGLLQSYLVLRPFNEIQTMCEKMLRGETPRTPLGGLNSRNLIIKLGHYLTAYVSAKKSGKTIDFPNTLSTIKGPAMDWVFGFQFLCMMIFLTVITVSAINLFTTQLYSDLAEVALAFLNKPPKGIDTFIRSQSEIIDLIILVPSLGACVLYAFIARILISKVEGVTYAYIRDVRDLTQGQVTRRLKPRFGDPGKGAAAAVNGILDDLYPRPKKEEVESVDSGAQLSPA